MSSSKRWQHDEDSERLPEGMKRVGYDADTERYTFLDRKGTLYTSAPGNRYGHLSPVADPMEKAEKERPAMFQELPAAALTAAKPLTFQDFVPPELITSPQYGPDDPRPKSSSRTSKEKKRSHSRNASTASSSSSPSKSHAQFTDEPASPREKFRDAVKSSGVPKMQGVVQSLRRSVTSVTKKRFASKGRERPKSEIQEKKTATDYVQLAD